MKWILVWWVIHPWHGQCVHIVRDLPNESACSQLGATMPVHNGAVRWHCSLQ